MLRGEEEHLESKDLRRRIIPSPVSHNFKFASSEKSSRNMLSVTDFAYLALALFFNTFTAPAVKITQSSDGKYSYNKYSIYFIAELIKLSFAAGSTLYQYHTDKDKQKVMKVSTRDMWQYAIPGFVFFAQNNLSFIALQHMSNAAFQLLLNMRIVAVALLTVARLLTCPLIH